MAGDQAYGDNPLGTILSVWAHPDDETYLAAGLMARAAAAGDRVVCVTATRGELGSPDEERWPSGAPLAAVRTKELETALALLGVSEHHWLDYPDGGCAQVDQDEAVRRIGELVRDVRPDTVLTFGPDGMTGHDDHRAVCRWTTAAVDAVAPAGLVLGYSTHTPEWVAEFRGPLDEVGAFMGAEPPSTPRSDLLIDLTLADGLLDTKLRALRSMTSQIEPLIAALGDDFFLRALVEEAFRRP